MIPSLPPLFRLFKIGFVAALALVMVESLHAVAPAAPVITRVDFSQSGFKTLNHQIQYDGNGVPIVDTTGAAHSYVVRWDDKSLDEEGFQLEVRVGSSSPFETIARLAANSQEVLLSPLIGLPPKTVVEFRLAAWKFNGATIEKGTSVIFPFTIPEVGFALGAPTGLVATNVNDSTVKLSWTDTSPSELYYQIIFREVRTPAVNFQHLSFANLSSTNPTLHSMRLRLVPNTAYEFQVRGTLQNPGGTSPLITGQTTGFSGTAALTTQPLAAPTQLSATALSEDLIRLQWRDNSTNETGYDIQARLMSNPDPEDFSSLGTTGENSTFVNVPVQQDSSLEWRVVALYTYTPSGQTTQQTIRSLPSNKVTKTTDFPAPSQVTASTSPGVANTVDLTWTDNTNSEGGFNIYTRPTGGANFHFARAVRAGVTKVSVNSRSESNDANGKPVFIPLEVGVTHEFVVRAVSQDETIFSTDSNTATAAAKDGFTSRLYEPAQMGAPFNYAATVSNNANRSSWGVTGLPAGLIFNSTNGQIAGTPTAKGLFQCPMTVTYVGGATASATLTLRVLPAFSGPSINGTFQATTIGINAPFNIPLSEKFTDSDAETAVRLTTTKGNIDIVLYPSLAPRAVANFMAYVNGGDYDGMAFHRLIPGFVLQGGSLKPIAAPRNFVSIPGRPAAVNEPGIGNVAGTIAAAKVGARNSVATLTDNSRVARDDSFGYVGDPDSATTDFFLNLANNVSNLDNQNGGFTAFGRITNPGMIVVNAIAALRTGNYLNSSPSGTYNAALDKRLIVDGAASSFTDVPMEADPAPADMDINKTVRITKAATIPVITYNIVTNPTGIATATVVGNDLRLTGLAAGTTQVTVIANDLNNGTVSQNFTVTVAKGQIAPAITKHPVAQAVLVNTKATFSTSATGTALTYRWRKNGEIIPGQSGAGLASFSIASTQAGDEGLYDVQVGNATTTITSNRVRLDLRTIPAITLPLVPMVVEVGKPLVMQTAATGSLPPTFAWKRGTAVIAGQTTDRLSITAAKLTDAGIYSVTATNTAGKATSNSVNVIVVDKTASTKVIAQNATISLTAAIAGPPGTITYHWLRDDQNITAPHITGTETAVLKITGAKMLSDIGSDSGDYICVATLSGGLGSVQTGITKLAVVTKPSVPALSDENAPPAGYIGVNYSWPLPYSKLISNTPTGFLITGLPPGLTYNAVTGVVSGKPTKVGSYPITAIAKNVAGNSTPTQTAVLTIAPLPAATIGTLVATIGASTPINGNKGGRLDLTVLDTGSYSAKLLLGKDTLSAAGTLGVGSGLFDVNTLSYQSRISIPRKGLPSLILAFEIDHSAGYVSGVLSDGTNSVAINGIRQFWDATLNPCVYGADSTTKSLSYNLGLNLSQADVGLITKPQGSGYLNMVLSTAGKATFSGRLSDGTTITGSSIIGIAGETLIFQMLYANTGSLLATIDIGDTKLSASEGGKLRVAGQARWIKDSQAATVLNYQAGIPETYLDILGTNYYAPTSLSPIVLGLPDAADNAQLDFSEGKLSGARDPSIKLRLTTGNAAVYPASNPATTRLTVVPATGAFTGTFALLDSTVARNVTYQGLIIPGIPATPAATNTSGVIVQSEIAGTEAYGAGYFLLPELLPSVTKSQINSGKVALRPAAIIISTQPVSQTVNPGATVTFSVVVGTAQGTLSYRWRKNGNTISGASGTSYSPPPVTEASQGVYDCVISNGAAMVTSAAANLSVNDPVTNVTLTRSPTTATIDSSQAVTVTFTAGSQGTGPFTYQWSKDSVVIPDATGSTYTIQNASVSDSGNYQVLVKNSVSTSGVASSNVNLSVANPVSITSISRSPVGEPITAGTPVTFEVSATGTGTLTYQWRKNEVAIPGATAATYTIPSTTTLNSGNYDVVVKNIVSTTGVTFTPVTLTVVEP
jgi:cyclophilin family peptidyl-prolyl cis-trans isomerase